MTEVTETERPRGVAYARVWVKSAEPILPAVLSDELGGRGFIPGFVEGESDAAPMQETGLADARFLIGDNAFQVTSLASSKGNGCRVSVHLTDPEEIPQSQFAQRAIPKSHLVYRIEAGGPSNSDRHLCENIAEILLLTQGGLVEIGGRGPKGGNRPTLYSSAWLGSLRD